MSWTYPIKRSTTQTKANPIVYFTAFFTCCNKRENESEWREIILFVSEGRGSLSSWLWTITSASYIGWMKIKFGPGRDNVSLPLLFKVLFSSPKYKRLEGWEKKCLCQLKKGELRGRKGTRWQLLSATSLPKKTFKDKVLNLRENSHGHVRHIIHWLFASNWILIVSPDIYLTCVSHLMFVLQLKTKLN